MAGPQAGFFNCMEIRNIAIIAHVDHPSTTTSLRSVGYGAGLIANATV